MALAFEDQTHVQLRHVTSEASPGTDTCVCCTVLSVLAGTSESNEPVVSEWLTLG